MFRKSIIVLISLILSLALPLSACACNSSDEVETKTRGTHIRKIEQTEEDIIKDGFTEYKVLIPEDASTNIQIAKNEFLMFFKEATGISLSVEEDSLYAGNAKYFSIGKTKLLDEKGLTADSELGQDGFRITTKDSSVFMYGYSDFGSLYAVYDLLNCFFDFEPYYADLVVVNKNVKNLKLSNFDIKEKPDFAIRIMSPINSTWKRRLRGQSFVDIYADALPDSRTEAINHNSTLILDQNIYNNPDKPETYHPDWFLDSTIRNPASTQLCYTAHGNESEWQLMTQEVAKILRNVFIKTKQPKDNLLMVQFSAADNARFCSCDACLKNEEKYGSKSGDVVNFCNTVSGLIDEWLNSEEGAEYKRDYRLVFFAYESYAKPPVKSKDKGKNYATIRCEKNVVPLFMTYNGDHLRNIDHKNNKDMTDFAIGWGLCSDTLLCWNYSANYTDYMYMYDNFGQIQELYRFLYDNNFSYLYDEGTRQSAAQPGFYSFKMYLESKLAWNIDSDVDEITQKYFKNNYGPASDTMFTLFSQHRAYNAMLKDSDEISFGGGNSSSMWMNMNNKDFWDLPLVEAWYNMCNRALQEIEPLKIEDTVRYNAVKNNILMERLSYIYTLVSVFEDELTHQEAKALKTEFAKDARELPVMLSTHANSTPMSVLLEKWGV